MSASRIKVYSILHTPLTPIAVTSLAGIGGVLGAGVASGRGGTG